MSSALTGFVVCALGQSREAQARACGLSQRLGAPLCVSVPAGGGFALCVHDANLELRLWRAEPSPPRAASSRPAPPITLTADFIGGALARRQREPGFLSQPLCRALGMPRRTSTGARYLVVDATAGLGRDAALLVYAGCDVHAVERSPLLVALLEDAWVRAREDAAWGEHFAARFRVHGGDARAWFAERPPAAAEVHAVYMDPMFPERRKAALVKKDMQILQHLHGAGGEGQADDEYALWLQACAVATERVVVKRPTHAPPLAPGVNHAVSGGTVRFDVYLTAARSPAG